MLGNMLLPDLEELINRRDWEAVREGLSELEPADGAELIAELPSDVQVLVFRLLPRALASDIFELLPVEEQAELVEALSNEQIEAMLNAMAPDDRTRLLEELPAAVVQRALAQLHPEQLRVARRLLGYPERSAGRVMTPEYVALPPLMSARQALSEIKKRATRAETVSVVYLIDEKGRLVDELDLSAVVLAPDDTLLASLADGQFIAVPAHEDQSEVVRLFEKYDRFALPVIDTDGVLVGIITVDDVLDVAEREATEDIQKLGGSEALDAPYLETSVRDMLAKRGPWLVVLFLGQMLTATAMAYYESEIAKAVVLALFIPLVISSGGNSGSQSTSLVIRALALDEVSLSDWWHIVRREVLTGGALGVGLGVLGYMRIVLWPNAATQFGEHYVLIGVTVAAALLGVVLFGTLAGAALPLVLKRLGLDPAAASAPFVATLVDVTGLVIYFTVASFVLEGTLL